jgi:hypothetical protein
VINFVNFKIKPAQSFGDAHRIKICVRVSVLVLYSLTKSVGTHIIEQVQQYSPTASPKITMTSYFM